METTLEPQPSLSLGGRRAWARDFALVGAATMLALPLVAPIAWSTACVATLVAALLGGAFGVVFPTVLDDRVRRVPVVLLLAAGLGLGACWGGLALFTAATLGGGPRFRATQVAATAGALQFAWLWLPLVVGRAKGRRVGGWIALAIGAAPLAGWVAYQHATLWYFR